MTFLQRRQRFEFRPRFFCNVLFASLEIDPYRGISQVRTFTGAVGIERAILRVRSATSCFGSASTLAPALLAARSLVHFTDIVQTEFAMVDSVRCCQPRMKGCTTETAAGQELPFLQASSTLCLHFDYSYAFVFLQDQRTHAIWELRGDGSRMILVWY